MRPLYEVLDEAEDFTSADAKVLQDLLTNKVLQRALACVQRESIRNGAALLTAPLETDVGRSLALRMQGVSKGLIRAIDILNELQKQEEDDAHS